MCGLANALAMKCGSHHRRKLMNTPGKFNAVGTQLIFKSQDPHFRVYRIFNLGSAEMEVSYTDSAGNHAPSVHIQAGASLDSTASEISVHGSPTIPAKEHMSSLHDRRGVRVRYVFG